VAVASAGHMQVYTSLQTDNHASTSPLSFLQAGCPSCHPTNSVKALKASEPVGHIPPLLNEGVQTIYRVGQKSKLLILSEYVSKTEKIGEM